MGNIGSENDWKYGVVTFLDILGWKGIWQRKIKKPMDLLDEIIEYFLIGLEYWKAEYGRNIGRTDIVNISDTFAIFSELQSLPITGLEGLQGNLTVDNKSEKESIELHGFLCKMGLIRSIELGIPLRGATSIGKFIFKDNRFVGEAVDEAADWYEATDWIGVHMTPTASFRFREATYWLPYTPPFNKGPKWETNCLDWIQGWYPDEADINKRKQKLKDAFMEMGPIGPDIVGKFTNTLKFFDYCTRDISQPEKGKNSD